MSRDRRLIVSDFLCLALNFLFYFWWKLFLFTFSSKNIFEFFVLSKINYAESFLVVIFSRDRTVRVHTTKWELQMFPCSEVPSYRGRRRSINIGENLPIEEWYLYLSRSFNTSFFRLFFGLLCLLFLAILLPLNFFW